MNYCLQTIEDLTPVVMAKIIENWRETKLPYLKKMKNYFLGKQSINFKQLSDATKPCNKLTNNFCGEIVENYAGYICGNDITYSSDENIEDFINVLNYNDSSFEDNTMLRNALIYGISAEVNWIDYDGKQRFKYVDSSEIIPIYKSDIERQLLCVLRIYQQTNWNDTINYYCDVYDDYTIRHYKTDSLYSSFELLDVEEHYYGQCPVNIFDLNDDNLSIFDGIISLQDAYNKLLSGEVDDFESFADCYLVLKGVTADESDIAQMKQNRVLLLDTDCSADYLTKNISSTTIEQMLDRVEKNIHELSKCPNFADESFGTSSGIAMQYKLLGFIQKSKSIASHMKKFLQRRVELIAEILNLTNEEQLWRDIDIEFNYNLPVDNQALSQLINSYRGLVSDETLLSQIPFVKDVNEELNKITEQKENQMSLYNFNIEDDE